MDNSRSDCILREILEDRKSLTGFLDTIFGFMSRNTDFYHIQNTKDDKLGFPRGVKEEIVISCMQKYEHTLEESKNAMAEVPSFVAEEIEIVTEEANEQFNKTQRVHKNFMETNKECRTNTMRFNKSDYKNGSVFETYCWSQTLKDIEINILLPEWVKLAKHIKVNFHPKNITIKTLFPTEEVLLSGETWDKYMHNNVIWSMSDGKLIISFDKRKQCWWDKMFLHENSIDGKTVDTELSGDNYTTNVQNTLDNYKQEVSSQHNIETKTLNESEQIARLRQAWNGENSPFKGQPFDPSVVQFN